MLRWHSGNRGSFTSRETRQVLRRGSQPSKVPPGDRGFVLIGMQVPSSPGVNSLSGVCESITRKLNCSSRFRHADCGFGHVHGIFGPLPSNVPTSTSLPTFQEVVNRPLPHSARNRTPCARCCVLLSVTSPSVYWYTGIHGKPQTPLCAAGASVPTRCFWA